LSSVKTIVLNKNVRWIDLDDLGFPEFLFTRGQIGRHLCKPGLAIGTLLFFGGALLFFESACLRKSSVNKTFKPEFGVEFVMATSHLIASGIGA